MKNECAAFTLMELLVYMVLFAGVAVVMMSSCSIIRDWSSRAIKQQHSALAQALGLDVIMRDIASASCKVTNWSIGKGVFRKEFLNDKQQLVQYDVGYSCTRGVLMREQGFFDYTKDQWRQRRVAPVPCDGVLAVTLKPQRAEKLPHITGCVVELETAQGKQQALFRPRSRWVAYAR